MFSQEKLIIFEGEHPITRIPIVLTVPVVHVPLAIVPVDVHDARALLYPYPPIAPLIEYSPS